MQWLFLAGVWYGALWRVVDFSHGRARRWGFLHFDTRKMKTWFAFWTRFLREGCRFCQKKSRKRVRSLSCSSEGGVGLGGVGWGWYYTCLLLRHLIFSCTWCYATGSSLLRPLIFSCTWCYATGSSVLRHLIFSCTWCYATGSSVLRHLIFFCTWCYATGSLEGGVGLGGVGWGWYYTCLLLRRLVFSCTWCYATGSSLLRHLIFSCTWCYATGSLEGGVGFGWGGVGMILHLSLATPLDLLLHLVLRHWIFCASPLDLLLHLMLRHWIFRRGGGVGWGGDDMRK